MPTHKQLSHGAKYCCRNGYILGWSGSSLLFQLQTEKLKFTV